MKNVDAPENFLSMVIKNIVMQSNLDTVVNTVSVVFSLYEEPPYKVPKEYLFDLLSSNDTGAWEHCVILKHFYKNIIEEYLSHIDGHILDIGIAFGILMGFSDDYSEIANLVPINFLGTYIEYIDHYHPEDAISEKLFSVDDLIKVNMDSKRLGHCPPTLSASLFGH